MNFSEFVHSASWYGSQSVSLHDSKALSRTRIIPFKLSTRDPICYPCYDRPIIWNLPDQRWLISIWVNFTEEIIWTFSFKVFLPPNPTRVPILNLLIIPTNVFFKGSWKLRPEGSAGSFEMPVRSDGINWWLHLGDIILLREEKIPQRNLGHHRGLCWIKLDFIAGDLDGLILMETMRKNGEMQDLNTINTYYHAPRWYSNGRISSIGLTRWRSPLEYRFHT